MMKRGDYFEMAQSSKVGRPLVSFPTNTMRCHAAAGVALAALLLCALSPVLGQSTFTNTMYDPATYNADVIVIGAGVAGLMAANALQAGGLQVLLLEAGSVAGGRVSTNTSGALSYELGQFPGQ